MGEQRIERAVVIGGSVAGLAAAAALAPRVGSVQVVERHELPGSVASVAPQGRFAHVLLGGGLAALERLLPGFAADLAARGAIAPGPDGPPPHAHWWAAGVVRRPVPDLGVPMAMCSRALVETVLRERVVGLPGVEVLGGRTVRGLRFAGSRVVGLDVERQGADEVVGADLVVDASGRGSRAPAWLERAGFDAPPVSRIDVDITYAGVDLRRAAGDLDGDLFAIVQNGRDLARIGLALPAEGDRWQVVLGGYFGDAAPLDRDGFLAFAASLPDPIVADLLRTNEWVTEPRHHRYPSSQRRHWEQLRRRPEGFCVVGDGVASFNPIYGQGMSSAARQAVALGACVERIGGAPGLARAVARGTAKVVADPWRVAAGADFIYPRTTGPKARGTDAVNRYLERVFVAAATDPVVALALARVQHLLAPPSSLFRPPVVLRTAAARGFSEHDPAAIPPAAVRRSEKPVS